MKRAESLAHKMEEEPNAVDMAFDEIKRGENLKLNIGTLATQLEQNPQLFEGREAEIEEFLASSKIADPRVGEIMNKLHSKVESEKAAAEKEKRRMQAEPTQEIPAVKLEKSGIERLQEEVEKFKTIESMEDFIGYLGAVRHLASDPEYYKDENFRKSIGENLAFLKKTAQSHQHWVEEFNENLPESTLKVADRIAHLESVIQSNSRKYEAAA